jgi:hypothetical protein
MGSCAILGVTSGLDAHVVLAFGPEFFFTGSGARCPLVKLQATFSDVQRVLSLNVHYRHPQLACRDAIGRRIIDKHGI